MNWIRVEVDYSRARWLRREKRFVKDAWINLLLLVKLQSPRKGRIKFRDVEDVADQCDYDDDSVWAFARMIECALIDADGKGSAIVIEDGYLTVRNWIEYQSTEAQRTRKHRAQEPLPGCYETVEVTKPVTEQLNPLQTTYETGCNALLVARDTDPETDPEITRATGGSQGGVGGTGPRPRRAALAIPPSEEQAEAYFRERKVPHPREEAERFCDHYAARGWRAGGEPIADWKALARQWQKNIPEFEAKRLTKGSVGGAKSSATGGAATHGKPKEGEDYWLNGKSNPVRPCKMIDGKRSEEPFDEAEWRRNHAAG